VNNYDVDIMMIGHFSKDELVVDEESVHAPGGAIFYGSIPLRQMGLSVAVVTRVHPDDRHWLEPLEEAGIQVYAAEAPATSSIANIYRSENMERRICKLQSFAGAFEREDIPALKARVYMVVPIIAGEVDLPLLEWISQKGPVAMDVQGFVRVPEAGELLFRPWPQMDEGLPHVTYLKVDRAEAEHMTGETNLKVAARRLTDYGPEEIVLTQSSGVTVHAGGEFYQAPFTPRSLEGRTGRGDTCFSTYVGKRLSAPPEEATRFAAAVTTIKQERPGPWRGPMSEVEALLKSRGHA
jgi:sugar/nucleoside kinase (ribokinase family)